MLLEMLRGTLGYDDEPPEPMAANDRPWRDGVSARPWKANERRVVVRGFLGRLAIAVEPLLVALFFIALPIGLFARKWRLRSSSRRSSGSARSRS